MPGHLLQVAAREPRKRLSFLRGHRRGILLPVHGEKVVEGRMRGADAADPCASGSSPGATSTLLTRHAHAQASRRYLLRQILARVARVSAAQPGLLHTDALRSSGAAFGLARTTY